jgi:hypothetical protein
MRTDDDAGDQQAEDRAEAEMPEHRDGDRGDEPAAVPRNKRRIWGPCIGTGSAVADAREANAPVTTYIISVRYEDGSFTFVEQDDPPVIVKGDRVRVFDGRVELRQD